jgi:hypothetical protein
MTSGRKTKPPKSDKTPAAMPALNEWGIPDWRDPAAYGDVKRWTFDRWRWEFYRRRDDLRAYFDANAEQSYYYRVARAGQPGFPLEPPTPNEPGFTARGNMDTLKCFGYPGIPNPRIGDQPPEVISPHLFEGHADNWSGVAHPQGGMLGSMERLLSNSGVLLTEEQKRILKYDLPLVPVPLKDGQIAIIFDVNKPLKSQIDSALSYLQFEQSLFDGKLLQRRRHPAKWFGYLRTLDARDAGASWREIAAIHPSTAGTEQTARDIWQAANALRFNF